MTRELEDSRETVTCAVCVELYQDARVLNCSHSFCLHCLIGCQAQAGLNGVTEVKCPVCRETTIPPLVDIPLLPSNVFANKVAELIRCNDNPSSRSQLDLTDGDEEGNEESQFFVGNLLPEPTRTYTRRYLPTKFTLLSIALSVLMAGGMISLIGSWLGILVGLLVVAGGSGLAIRQERYENLHQMHTYMCNGCSGKQMSIIRYRCGMCNDFTLCPTCFAEDNLSQRQHIFLKLKFQQRRELPFGPVLKPQAFSLAETFDYVNIAHGRAYVHSSDRLLRLPGIKCGFCGVMPMKGFRYKCGMCSNYDLCEKCENHSHNIHDKSHVFMVLKFKAEINFIAEPLLRAQFY